MFDMKKLKGNNARAKHKYIPCDIYKSGIHVFIGEYNEMIKWAEKFYHEKEYIPFIESMRESRAGYADTHYYLGNVIVRLPIFPTSAEDIAVTTHEIYHAACALLQHAGIEYVEESTNEVYAYLIEHLMRNILKEKGYNKP